VSDSSEDGDDDLTDMELAAFFEAVPYDTASDAPTAQPGTAYQVGFHTPLLTTTLLFSLGKRCCYSMMPWYAYILVRHQ
jgi:hypothetical protein